MPPEEEYPFHKYSDEILTQAKRVTIILELTEYRWTINEILEQPEELLNAICDIKLFGEKIRTQNRNARRNENSDTEVI